MLNAGIPDIAIEPDKTLHKVKDKLKLGKMAFNLGGTCRISDTRGPIWMKRWGCIEVTLRLCNVIFSTSDFDLKPEVGCFWKPEVPIIETGSRKYA